MAMNMPKVLNCSMSDCSYNSKDQCHAMAITVGSASPVCDTFMKSSKKGGVMDMSGSVGACKVDTCRFNDSLECSAEGISVSMHSDHAECDTFQSR